MSDNRDPNHRLDVYEVKTDSRLDSLEKSRDKNDATLNKFVMFVLIAIVGTVLKFAGVIL